jgi:hypothetical protein
MFVGSALDERVGLLTEEVQPYATLTLEALSYMGHPPVFTFDMVDTDLRSGWRDNRQGLIHLHPERITRWVILHEMAHWLDPEAHSVAGTVVKVTHGQSFRTMHWDLVRSGLCEDAFLREEAARTLTTIYLENKVPIATDYARPW